MLFSGALPHLVELLGLKASILIKEIQQGVALLYHFRVKRVAENNVKDTVFIQPVEKELTVKPFLHLEGLQIDIQWRVLARLRRLVPDFLDLDGQNVMSNQLLLKDGHFQALVSNVKLEILA